MFALMNEHRTADRSEWQSTGRLLGHGLGEVVNTVADMHDTIVKQVERRLPFGMANFATSHRVFAATIYRIVGFGHRTLPATLARLAPSEGTPISSSKLGGSVLPILHGLWGDAIEARQESLAITMSLRSHGRDIDDVTCACTKPTGRLVIFMHGLFEDEQVWLQESAIGTWFEKHEDLSPLFVRYNSGLRVSENGRRLSDLIGDIVHDWPVPVTTIALVGHSMGGLVARSAGHYAQQDGADWLPLLTHVITLSSPHLGSPVEKAVHTGDWVLRRIPQTRPLGDVVYRRSAGIKDLRFGAVVDEDWMSEDPDDFLIDRCTDVSLLDGVTYYWVAGWVSQDPDGVMGRLIGDGIVRFASASGRGTSRRVHMHHGVTVTGVNHFNLVRSKAVHDQVLDWLN